MSDNVVYPPFPPRPGQVGGGGGGSHLPDMEPRVAALEADMKDVKSSLKGLEASSIRVEAMLASMATKADVAALGGRVEGLAATLAGMNGRLDKAEKAIDSKVIGPWQLPGILAACVGICVAGVAVYNWVVAHVGLHP